MTTSGWVKSTTASAPDVDQLVDRVVLRRRGHQLEVGRRLDRPAHLGPDLALRAQDPDLDRVAHGAQPSRRAVAGVPD